MTKKHKTAYQNMYSCKLLTTKTYKTYNKNSTLKRILAIEKLPTNYEIFPFVLTLASKF